MQTRLDANTISTVHATHIRCSQFCRLELANSRSEDVRRRLYLVTLTKDSFLYRLLKVPGTITWLEEPQFYMYVGDEAAEGGS